MTISRTLRAGLGCLVLCLVLAAAPSTAAPTGQTPPSLAIGFNDNEVLESNNPAEIALVLGRARGAGASVFRFEISWGQVARTQPPSLAQAADPTWSGYDWSKADTLIRDIAAAGMTPLVVLGDAPTWAEGTIPAGLHPTLGSWEPSASSFGAFAKALAARYTGSFVDATESSQPLPAVRYWEAWNEPNLANYLAPQWTASNTPASPAIYRSLLDAFYAGIKSVAPQDLVGGGTTAPFGDPPGGARMAPLTFWRALLCLSAGRHPHAVCHQRAYMDALAHHPYPLGPPTTHAVDPNDVSVPDLGQLTRLVPLAEHAGTLLPKGPKPVWVTELSWDTNPPDPNGVSPALQAQYLEGSLYVLWKDGARLITWWNVRDDNPQPGWVTQLASGVYTQGATFAQDTAKPSYTAFAFPFTAYRVKGIAQLWGMAPTAGAVQIQEQSATSWTTVLTLQANADRIFAGKLLVGVGTSLRAVSGPNTSLTWTAFANPRP